MNCEDALLLISGHMDGENTPEEEAQLQSHLSQCAQCRAVLEAYVEMDRGIAALTVDAPADLRMNVMSAVRKEVSGKKKTRRWWSVAAAAAVVALVVGVTGLPVTQRTSDSAAAPMVIQAQTETMGYALTADQSRTVSLTDPQSVAEAYGAHVAVARELLPEMELCTCETLQDGTLLYCLPGAGDAGQLAAQYDLELYHPTENRAECSYILLLA